MPKFTASLLPRGGRPPCHWRPKGPGTTEQASSCSEFLPFHESEPRSGMSGEALPASQRQPLASRQHSSDGSGAWRPALLRTELLLCGTRIGDPAWQPLFNNLENVYSSAGRLHPWIQKHSALGLPAVESEIPLVTVTENAGLLLEGLCPWVFTNTSEERRPAAGAQEQGPGPGRSAQLRCPLLALRQLPFPSVCCLLGGDEAAWEPVFPRPWQLTSC